MQLKANRVQIDSGTHKHELLVPVLYGNPETALQFAHVSLSPSESRVVSCVEQNMSIVSAMVPHLCAALPLVRLHVREENVRVELACDEGERLLMLVRRALQCGQDFYTISGS